jgi:large subunit ribosomal protein L16
MALAPARTKYRKSQKGSRAGNAKRGNTLAFGEFGLQSLTRGPMTGQQIEAARVTISRHLKRKGKLWIRVFPHKPVTKKPAEVRMGQGKGPVEFYVAVIKPGAVLFELAGIPARVAKEAFPRRRQAPVPLPLHRPRGRRRLNRPLPAMTSKEIRDLSPAEITTKIREIRESLLQSRLRKQTGQVEKTHELRTLRKDIARLETILRQKNQPAPVAA